MAMTTSGIKNLHDSDDENDFGWGEISAEEDTLPQSQKDLETLSQTIDDLKNRLRSVDNMITPLFHHLMKDADKPMIKWPNRKPVLEEKLNQFKSFTEFDN